MSQSINRLGDSSVTIILGFILRVRLSLKLEYVRLLHRYLLILLSRLEQSFP